MGIQTEAFGSLADGRQVDRLILTGAGGLRVSVLTYGATLQAIEYGGRDVLLGYDRLEDYVEARGSYQGATVGRYANRIKGGRFTLNGTAYVLACNDGNNHLHGGRIGFDKKIWTAQVLNGGDAPAVKLSIVSEDMEEGYPGRLDVSVTMTVTADNVLQLAYEARGDKDTVINLTNHAYFNLNGWDGGDVRDTELTVFADRITEADGELIPTGRLLPVEGTPFDFRGGRAIGEALASDHPLIRSAGGVDHNFVLGTDRCRRHAARAVSPRSGIALDCYTDLPGVQVYTANALDEAAGKGGVKLHKHQGFCLETQFFPDSPNQPAFPSTVLKAGEVFRSTTSYAFR